MENIFAISTSRYRINVSDSTLGAATELEFFGGRKGNDYLNEIRKEKTRVRRSKKKEKERKKWSVVVTEVVDKPTEEETSESFHPSEKEDVGGDESFRMEDDQDSAFESDGYKGDSDCEGSVGVARRRAGLAARSASQPSCRPSTGSGGGRTPGGSCRPSLGEFITTPWCGAAPTPRPSPWGTAQCS